jgi:very-short-patch-repair endonuclease
VESRKVANPDARVGEIAARQHGVVSLAQLRGLGLTEKAVRGRVAAGRLHRIHRGVYAVGHPHLSVEGRFLAAVLAVGRGPHGDGGPILPRWRAAVSHRSAASLWGLLPSKAGACDVIVPGDAGRRRRPRIRIHRSRSLDPVEVTLRNGVPVTTPARAIADLRCAVAARFPGAPSPRELRRAIRQANVLGLPIGEEDAEDRSRSDLEAAFFALCRRHRLIAPEVNVRVGPYLVDFLWRADRLVVETDGYLYHRGRQAFRDDRRRALELRRLGFEVVSLSEEQINEESDRIAEVLHAALAGGTVG